MANTFTNDDFKLNGRDIDFIPIFEWTLVKNENEKSQIRKSFSIADRYNIVATDNNGNILVESENKLFQIDHEDPTESPLELTSNFTALIEVSKKLCSTQKCTIDTPLKEIKAAKVRLKNIRTECPKLLKNYLDTEIENLSELISDYKFYSSVEGKRYLLTEEYKKNLYSRLGKPLRYKYIEAEREFKSELIKVNGICVYPTETIDEIKQILTSLEPPYKVEVGTLLSFEDYQRKINEKSK